MWRAFLLLGYIAPAFGQDTTWHVPFITTPDDVVERMQGRLQPVWPEGLAGERGLAPFVAWAQRKVLQ